MRETPQLILRPVLPGYQNQMKTYKIRILETNNRYEYRHKILNKKPANLDFPRGTVVKNLPANARDTGSSPGPGRSHMPWSN